MISFTYQIQDPMGFHARPVGFLAKLASSSKEVVTVEFNEKQADARRLYQVLGLGIKTGDTMTVHIVGENEIETKEKILELFKEQQL